MQNGISAAKSRCYGSANETLRLVRRTPVTGSAGRCLWPSLSEGAWRRKALETNSEVRL